MSVSVKFWRGEQGKLGGYANWLGCPLRGIQRRWAQELARLREFSSASKYKAIGERVRSDIRRYKNRKKQTDESVCSPRKAASNEGKRERERTTGPAVESKVTTTV